MPSEHAKLDAITNLGVELSRVKDLDILYGAHFERCTLVCKCRRRVLLPIRNAK